MEIVETSLFTKRIGAILKEEEYRTLQSHLVENPDSDVVVPGAGGIRKIRWGMREKGKRGGARVIYYWAVSRDKILMLHAFAKSERVDLTRDQLAILKGVVEEEFKDER
jgi:mRNA-degrading endonuclease RelE of RelBE toxin-antitoxin system